MWNLAGGLRFSHDGIFNDDLLALQSFMMRKGGKYFLSFYLFCVCDRPDCVTEHLLPRNP